MNIGARFIFVSKSSMLRIMKSYDPAKIEKKWQEVWKEDKLYETPNKKEGKDNFYTLVEFSYPSGDLHTGHWYAFAVPDIFVRRKRMQGFNSLFPIGFDAFGLPAENAAIKRGINPRVWTEQNMETMRAQLHAMGSSFDWSREVVTCHPDYYRWTQWIFTKFLEKGLAYQAETSVNWCASCKTVLANEQVVGGKCERCDHDIEKRHMKQWMLRITDYAESLLKGLEGLDWPEEIKTAQRNWIGKSKGVHIEFKVTSQNKNDQIKVFTTRPDTLFGVTFLVIGPEHELFENKELEINNKGEVEAYIVEARKKTLEDRFANKEKTGVKIEGVVAINPTNNSEIPIFVADYVLGDVGTGAIMAVPGHDERDFEFARKFNLEIVEVISGGDISKEAYTGNGVLVNSEEFDGMSVSEAKEKITKKVEGEITTQYRLRDWVVSRQRYWGCPIPIIHCGSCAKQQVIPKLSLSFYHDAIWEEIVALSKTVETRALNPEEKDRYFGNIIAGDVIECVNKNSGEKKIFTVTEVIMFKNVEELWEEKSLLNDISPGRVPDTLNEYKEGFDVLAEGYLEKIDQNGLVALRIVPTTVPVPVPEADLPVVLPDVDDYLPTGDGKSPLAKADEWVNVVCPSCGQEAKRETDTFDTFIDSSWYFLRYIDPANKKEFSSKETQKNWMPIDVYSGGAEHTTMHLLYSRFFQHALHDLELVNDKEPYKKRMNRSIILGTDGTKMSKSKGNVINPDEYVKKLGADTVRMYLAFIGPYDEVGSYPWNPDSIIGMRKFLDRLWRLQEKVADIKTAKNIEQALHQAIGKTGEDILKFRFNTAISALMILLNVLEKEESISGEVYKTVLRLFAPFAPHITEELWHMIGEKNSVHLEQWPLYDEKKAEEKNITIALQVNGKVRDTIEVARGLGKSEMEKLALGSEKIQKYVAGKTSKRIIVVPNKLVNIVI